MKTVLIPVELCEHVLKEKLSKPFQLYVLLKSLCDGKMKIPKNDYPALAAMLGRKAGRTVGNNLTKLCRLNFIGYNPASEYYFIRGLDQLRVQLNLHARTSAVFDMSDILCLQAFCLAAVAGHTVKQQQRKKWLCERKKWRSKQHSRLSSNYFLITYTYLSKKLGISLQTAYALKQKAKEAGFIDIIKHLEPLNVAAYDKKAYLKGYPENAHLIRKRDGLLYIQQGDELVPKIRFKSRKKIKTYISGS